MKKTYMNPTLEVVELHIANSLLAGSGVADGSTLGNSVVEGEDYARGSDMDDDF